jgi:4-hydroxybutyrate CoA-transferase
MNFQEEYKGKLKTALEAVALVQDRVRIYPNHSNQASVLLLDALCDRKNDLKGVSILASTGMDPYRVLDTEYEGIFDYCTLFIGNHDREAMKKGRTVDNICYQISKLQDVLHNVFKPTVLFVMAAPMDEEGYFNLSMAANDMHCVADEARLVIMHVNSALPRIPTIENRIHISQVDVICEHAAPITTFISPEPDTLDRQVAAHVLERVRNGSTIQIGIGGIANAIGYSMDSLKHLGIHTELFTDSLMYLMKSGAVDNSEKNIHKDKSVFGFAFGSREMYDFLDNNGDVLTRPLAYTNNPYTVAQMDNFVSVNACLGVDITGQVASDTLGMLPYSGTGGQLDFVRGAQMSKGGQSFLCLHSVIEKQDGSRLSKICFNHPPGTAITVPRTDVQYVVTEYGIADLENKSRIQRTRAMIGIAHPDFRDELTFQAKKVGYL